MRGAPTRSERAELIARPGLDGRALARALSDATDAWLAPLLRDEAGVALVAVGGYGRRELCPGSDLDLLLVHDGRRDVAKVAERVWYPVWDSGVALDHSVRSVKEALAVADADLRAVLGLLDARFVAGDADLAGDLLTRLRAHWRRRAPRALAELRSSAAARHARAGDVAFLVEPDLKEGRGGLRDVHAMRAAAAAWVVDAPPARVGAAYDVLLAARVGLHRVTGRGNDHLTLQEQDQVARVTGHADATALMADVSAAARTVAWALDETWRRVDRWSAGARRRLSRPTRSRPLARGLAEHGGELVLAAGAEVGTDPALPLRAGALAAEQGLPLSTRLLERLAADSPSPPEPWPTSVRQELVRLLAAGTPAISAWESLDQYELVERMLPEWAAVRSRPQRNP